MKNAVPCKLIDSNVRTSSLIFTDNSRAKEAYHFTESTSLRSSVLLFLNNSSIRVVSGKDWLKEIVMREAIVTTVRIEPNQENLIMPLNLIKRLKQITGILSYRDDLGLKQNANPPEF
jgi:hypothetical protein